MRLPEGVEAVWDLERAYRETTPTRERVCVNGLWRWQPAAVQADTVPAADWGYFKVPGSWPGITDYMQKDSQTVHAHPNWRGTRLRDVTAAWYQREITVPDHWKERRIALSVAYLNSLATVYVDARKAGELRFPAGELDLTPLVRPGERHVLSLRVAALPLQDVLPAYTDSAAARTVKGAVARRGLCGDLFLVSTPPGAQLSDTRLATSVRRGEIRIETAPRNLRSGESYTLLARITDQSGDILSFKSAAFGMEDLESDRFAFTAKWQPERLWDTHTPGHQYDLHLELRDAAGALLDAPPPERFGFREFWIDGRDFYLNGSCIFLSAVPLDNAQVGAALATYDAARESFERLRLFGINFVYTHNYDCRPGAHLSFAEILRAADDTGMLVALSQPHFSHYDWTRPDADARNGYAEHAAFYVRVAGSHPSVVMYATSHNATGYNEDMNPDLMDGRSAPRDTWAANNVRRALRAEAIVGRLDPSRILYHHASGNLGPMHLSNFYPNFVPVQEMSDWFASWAAEGLKPLFLCEYGAPFTWDWAMYRGWYRGTREFGSARVPWEFCLAEWNAQFLGDRAFAISEQEKRNLRWEARQFREGRVWHRWDYPHALGSTDLAEREPVFARYFAENWRAFRTWGLSANSPWEHHILYKLRPGVDRNRRVDLAVDWANLQRPGFSPDYLGERFERMDTAYDRADWLATGGAEALIRNNRPLLAFIGGKPARFTSKDHLFEPGETLEKQLIVINNSRATVHAEGSWTLDLPGAVTSRTRTAIDTGRQIRLPLRFDLPEDLAPGAYRLTADVRFDTGETQHDTFVMQVLPPRPTPRVQARVAVFDPEGATAEQLRALGLAFKRVEAAADLAPYDLLVVGRGALTVQGRAPDIRRVRDGLKVLVFEQGTEVLEQRFGFRVTEYGLREVFARVPDHPALAGIEPAHLRDWRGEATLLPPRLSYASDRRFNGAPTVTWCGIPVTRAWRCGNQGNVASVLIEKPARGDFLPVIDGGFSLQYSPLLEYREGKGLVLFCQMDVTARTEGEPAARRLICNLLEYAADWTPVPERRARYAGRQAGRAHLHKAGMDLGRLVEGDFVENDLLIVGTGGGEELRARTAEVAAFLSAGGLMITLGLEADDVAALGALDLTFRSGEHINASFAPPGLTSPLAGVGPADVHCRDPRVMPLVAGGAEIQGNGVLAVSGNGRLVVCQLSPWQFEYTANYGLKRTFRRSAFLVARLLGNLGARGDTPLIERWAGPPVPGEPGRWQDGFYLDLPEEWDDPYRFFRW